MVLHGASQLGIWLNHLTRPSKRGGPWGQNSPTLPNSPQKKKTTTTATTGTTGREVIVNIHNSSQLCEPCDPLSLDSTIFYKYSQSLTLQPLAAPISHGSGWRPRVRRPVNSAHFKWPAGGVQLNALTSFKDHPRISAYSLQPWKNSLRLNFISGLVQSADHSAAQAKFFLLRFIAGCLPEGKWTLLNLLIFL